MSACCLQKLNHMFAISSNTWLKRGILGKKGAGRGQYILGWVGNGEDTDDKTDPIFIGRTWTAG